MSVYSVTALLRIKSNLLWIYKLLLKYGASSICNTWLSIYDLGFYFGLFTTNVWESVYARN